MTALDKEHTDYTQESYEECVDFTGDLDEMLYPLALTEEKRFITTRQMSLPMSGKWKQF